MSRTDQSQDANIVDILASLADREFANLVEYASTSSPQSSAGLVIEACRCLDHANVVQNLAPSGRGQLSHQDFDLIQRGWNSFAGLLLPRTGGFSGIPLRESTPDLRRVVTAMLHSSGRHSILRKSSEMLRHGILSSTKQGNHITLRLSEGIATDFYHDQADQHRLADLSHKLLEEYRPAAKPELVAALREDMSKLVFPWNTPYGTMVGYSAEPHLDEYFLHAVTENAMFWSDEAGLHPRADLAGTPGAAVRVAVLVLMSFYLKHIMFVEEGIKKIEGLNPYMSLTIWKDAAGLRESLCAATGMHASMAEKALDFLILRRAQAGYLLNAGSPWIPMLIEISDDYFLSPVSSIFRNPFHGIRMFQETVCPSLRHAFAEHREQWMLAELYNLFQGQRFDRIPHPVRLRRKGSLVTDIDGAIYDRTTDKLVLFQLKWQDFSTGDLKPQRSKAKNFRDQVEKWARNTLGWIEEFSTEALLQTLKVKAVGGGTQTSVRLVAIGRSAARFRSYGFEVRLPSVLCISWPQLVRLRQEAGVVADFFGTLDERARREADRPVPRQPLPYDLELADCTVTFADIWSQFPDESMQE